MNGEKNRWRLAQCDTSHLSAALRPIRTSREVAAMLGISTSLVCQLENSALRKIVRALKALEDEERIAVEREEAAETTNDEEMAASPWEEMVDDSSGERRCERFQ